MATRRMAVLDDAGKVINLILVEDTSAEGYWPGYGTALVDLGPAPVEGFKFNPIKPAEFLGLLKITADVYPETGDTIDTASGTVTKKPAVVVVDEVVEP